MKLVTRILSLLLMVALSSLYVGCGGDDDGGESEEQRQFNKLKSSWTLTEAYDGTDRTDDFANLVLTLTGTFSQGGVFQYSFTGTRPNPSPWPGSGDWQFGTNPSSEIIRDPGGINELDMTYEVTDSELVISFNVPAGHNGWAGSRVGSVSGDWTFTFAKQ